MTVGLGVVVATGFGAGVFGVGAIVGFGAGVVVLGGVVFGAVTVGLGVDLVGAGGLYAISMPPLRYKNQPGRRNPGRIRSVIGLKLQV